MPTPFLRLRKDWNKLIHSITEAIAAESVFVYKQSIDKNSLELFLQQSPQINRVPPSLNAKNGMIREILHNKTPFFAEAHQFGEAFIGFSSPYLMASPLRTEKQVTGLVVACKRKPPSRREVDTFSSNSHVLSLLMTIDTLEAEREKLQQQNNELEQKLTSAHKQISGSDKVVSLSKFAGGLAHEINTPLGAIQTYAEYLQLFIKGESELESVEGILKAVDHCRNIIENIFQISRQGKRTFDVISLKEVIQAAVKLTQPELQKKKIRVAFDPTHDAVVLGNRTQLVQVVTNLLTNARDSILKPRLVPREGLVQISLKSEEPLAIIEVLDNGSGIPQEILGQIFDPFFTTKEVGQGVGLGLSICYAIVEEHSGRIEVSNENGVGTKISIKIPLACEQGENEQNRA